MTPSSADNRELARIAGQLEDIKRLTVMQLLLLGAQSGHIAKALGVDPGTISKMMPVRDIQKKRMQNVRD